jgi:Protein of unknown function (DUF5672)
MKPVAVLIPVYKAQPNANEIASLQQCAKILNPHPTILICPEGLDCSAYLAIHPNLTIQTFAPPYFASIKGYNQLLMGAFFYKKFQQYEYVLIYQLDAWVFRDELVAWCAKSYAYIGAPWIKIPPQTKAKVIVNLSKLLYNQVGNGGFSLRRVRTHYLSCFFFKPLIYFFPKNEDFFWCYFMSKINPFYKKPSVEEALTFAFELAPSEAYERTGQKLPFGCHAWEKYEAAWWKEKMEGTA